MNRQMIDMQIDRQKDRQIDEQINQKPKADGNDKDDLQLGRQKY